jgi:phosphate uptake regulator
MKRNIVKQGPTTLMISLPIKWVRRNNLDKGLEVNIEELGNDLLISSTNKKTNKEIDIHIDSNNGLFIWRYFQALYINGYTKIKVNYDNLSVLDELQHILKEFVIGFEITEQKPEYCILEEISIVDETSFDQIFKRIIYMIIDTSKNYLQYLENQNNNHVKIIQNYEFTNNKQTLYLKRMLLKSKIKNENSTFYYSLLSVLEKTMNQYRFMCLIKINNKDKELIKYYTLVDKLLNNIYKFYDKYDVNLFEDIIIKNIQAPEIFHLYKTHPELTTHFIIIINNLRHCTELINYIKMNEGKKD